jgi:hypothetical protein
MIGHDYKARTLINIFAPRERLRRVGTPVFAVPTHIAMSPSWVLRLLLGLVLYLTLDCSTSSQCVVEAKRYRTDAEQIVEDEAVAAWLDYWNYHGQIVEWTEEHKRTGMFVEEQTAGYQCTFTNEFTGEKITNLVYDRANIPASAEDCHDITYAEQRFNCDPNATTSNLCVDGRFNQTLKKLVFDGTCSCEELHVALVLKYGMDDEDLESRCRGEQQVDGEDFVGQVQRRVAGG